MEHGLIERWIGPDGAPAEFVMAGDGTAERMGVTESDMADLHAEDYDLLED